MLIDAVSGNEAANANRDLNSNILNIDFGL
jgi:hypothetical protein